MCCAIANVVLLRMTNANTATAPLLHLFLELQILRTLAPQRHHATYVVLCWRRSVAARFSCKMISAGNCSKCKPSVASDQAEMADHGSPGESDKRQSYGYHTFSVHDIQCGWRATRRALSKGHGYAGVKDKKKSRNADPGVRVQVSYNVTVSCASDLLATEKRCL